MLLVQLRIKVLLVVVSYAVGKSLIVAPSLQSCSTQYQTCHVLSYYISDPEKYFISDTEFIFLEGEHWFNREDALELHRVKNLSLKGAGQWLEGPEETVMQSSVVVHCFNEGHFIFEQSSDITIDGLTFINCGKSGFAAISVLQVNYATLFHTSLQNSSGYGLLTINSNFVEIIDSSFAYSNINHLEAQANCSRTVDSSNVAFEYSSMNSEAQLLVTGSNFTKGWALKDGGGMLIKASNSHLNATVTNGIFLQNTAACNGGGIAIILLDSIATVSFTCIRLQNGYSYTNSGGMYAKFISTQAELKIIEVILQNNTANVTNELSIEANRANSFNLLLADAIFMHNDTSKQSKFGIQLTAFENQQGPSFTFKNVTISLGNSTISAIYVLKGEKDLPEKSSLALFDVHAHHNMQMWAVLAVIGFKTTLKKCTFTDNSAQGDGSVIFINTNNASLILTVEDCEIFDNNMTGILLLSTYAIFQNRNLIKNNRNVIGGGLKLIAFSKVYINGILTLANNFAEKIGGAMYIQRYNLPFSTLSRSICTIYGFGSNSKIIFTGNRAMEGGSDMYNGIMVNCGIYRSHINRIGNPNETSYYFDTPLMKYFQFNNSDPLSSITTDPIMVCYCNNSTHFNCSDRNTRHIETYPGEQFHIIIATVGMYGGTSPGTVVVDIPNGSIDHLYGKQRTTTQCTSLPVLFNTSHPATVATLSVVGGLSDWGLSISVVIKECPPGFKLANSGTCQCAPLLQDHNIRCIISQNQYTFQRSGNDWYSYFNTTKGHCLTVFTNCPYDYCDPNHVSFDVRGPTCDNQCQGNRSGILCGHCQPGLSLLLGSNKCGLCSNIYLASVLLFALAGIMLVVVVIALNLTVSDGAINGLLFYANMLKLNEASYFASGHVPVTSQFISWLNLDLGISMCFFDGLDEYWKTWLQFVFPIYLFLLVIIIIVACQYSVWVCRLCGSNSVPALATVFLMSYTKILRTVTKALSMSQLVCNDSVLNVWSVDGNIPYASSAHLILMIFACFVLVVGVAYPLLVMFAPLLERYSDKCFPDKWNPVVKLKPLIDAYGGPYKDKWRFWTGVTLMVRLVITVIFSFTFGNLAYLNSYIINIVVIGYFTIWIFMKGVYRRNYLNMLEIFFLFNLTLLSNTTAAGETMLFRMIATNVSVGLSIIVFIIICSLQIWWNFNWRRLKQRFGVHVNNELQSLLQNECDEQNDNNNVPGSPPSHVYGSIRGQHQFDLFMNDRTDARNRPVSPRSPVLMEREPLIFS